MGPKPVFTWTLDGKPLTEMETRDEEVMVDADGLSKFSQSLIYTPEVWHANKTLSCSIVHPGLPNQLEASTRILLALPPSVRAASFPVSGIIGIAVFALLLTAIVVSLVVFKCRKARGLAEGKTDPEKAESNETGLDKGSKTESATEEEEEEEMKKEKAGLASKVTALLTKLRPEKKEEEDKEEDKPSTEEKPVRRGSETPV